MGLDILGQHSLFAVISDRSSSRFERLLPWALGATALIPLLWCARYFRDLWWFGDDWDLLDQIVHVGFWRWTTQVFAENFVPVFKVLWGGIVFCGGGSYFPMIAALWITHAVNVALVTKLLRAHAFGWTTTLLTALTFGLSTANIETLGWSVQWSAILAVTFFLLAALWEKHTRDALHAGNFRAHVILAGLVAGSALSFSRGVLTGASLAAIFLLPIAGSPRLWGARLQTAAVSFAPALVVAGVIFVFSGGNHHQLASGDRHWVWSAAEFGWWYWSIAPLYRLFAIETWGPHTTAFLGILKAIVILIGLRVATPQQRWLLVLLLLLDLGNTFLLGIGRYHTGLTATNGSRYQYNALLCTLPFIGVAIEAALQSVQFRPARWWIGTAIVAASIISVAFHWPREADHWAGWRGRETQKTLLRDPKVPAQGAVPGIEFMTTQRARELIGHYHLH